MSVVYQGSNIVIGVEGINEVERILGNLKSKTPAVAKVAVNSTARYTRREMIKHAKARYAVNAAGAQHLNDLKKTKSASNKDISAELYIASMRNDLSYFQIQPETYYIGGNVANAPEYFKGKVLKSSAMKALTGAGNLSKGFLLPFKSGHVGMVQRVIGSNSENRETFRSKVPRWTTRDGRVEKLMTMGSPSATAMHNTIWPEVKPGAEDYLMDALITRAYRVLELAQAKGR
ncbi:MAG: hypothetical protein J6N19_00420 [Clostridium sp.]|nr:hypothetical protein [Clostridium sp.]